MSDEQHKKLIAAAEFFNESARKLLATERGLHAETLISSVARMAGSLMYRSFGFDEKIAPGTSVLSDQANTHGPKLMNLMFVTLQQLGQQVGEGNINRDYYSRKFSQLTFQQAHEQLAAFFLQYCKAAQISFHDAALGAAIATGILINDCREVLDVEKGAAIAIYGFIEGTKTAPYPIGQTASQSPSTRAKKPWYKLW
ncbi:hypothetical protein KIK84_00110 [Curvibacter sp. CHRR-16]|uniref:hypothetical protein n=1 Tax=Curvibacter sp. CHRR-16 TaxID=2835872 RepID=UPI001BDB01BA|nr:hypothetical protein [Curvibacter sp. CHRR-16]MBT0568714.1 hypothetical protein [Curvibacter sp. CHRR-16]